MSGLSDAARYHVPVILLAATLASLAPPSIPVGASRVEVEVSGRRIVVLTYKPE